MKRDGVTRARGWTKGAILTLLLSACTAPGENPPDSADGPQAGEVLAVVVSDMVATGDKLMALAEALNEDQFAWTPGDGVRSSAQVFMHVATLNYFLPSLAGVDPPASTGISSADPATTAPAYENSQTAKQPVSEELRASFAHLRAAIEATPDSALGREVELFGGRSTLLALWVGHAGHVHEHLGQMIAYARTNGVVPPWNQ